jgi:hypothetical protein
MNPNSLQLLFFHALQRGTGEAYLLAKAYPTIDFSSFIINGALNNYAYDGQCESSRAEYMYELIQLSQKKEAIRTAFLKGLLGEQKDTWDLTHALQLALCYAREGDQAAKAAIYQVFEQCPIPDSDWAGVDEIIALDGWEGFLHVLATFGQRLAEDADAWQCDFLLQRYQEDHPEIDVRTALAEAAQHNRYLQHYLNAIETTKARWKRNRPAPPLYQNLLDEVLNSRFLTFKRIESLTLQERQELGFALLEARSKQEQEQLLRVFSACAFPFSSQFILDLAQAINPPDTRIQEYALSALKFLKSAAIRAFALARLPHSDHPAVYSNMLHANYQAGDAALLTSVVRNTEDEYLIEELASSYIQLYQKHPTPECQGPLEALYGKMNCGIHRHSLLKLLLAQGVLSKRIWIEAQYDSYLPTRALVEVQ